MHPYNSRFDFVGSRIILSPILSIPNSNHTQKYKYLSRKPFLLKREKCNENFYLKGDLGRQYSIESIQIDRDQIQKLRAWTQPSAS